MSEWLGERERGREGEGERQNSDSKCQPLILQDSSVRSIWTHQTASARYTGSKREMRVDDSGV